MSGFGAADLNHAYHKHSAAKNRSDIPSGGNVFVDLMGA